MSGKYALIIGNTEYIDPGLTQLTAPGKDTEDFARVLKDPNLCGFDGVRVLLNQLSSSVIEAIDEFFDQKKPDDMLVLYFSGHGVRDELGSLYLAFTNTIRTRLRSTAIKADYIKEAMDQCRSKRQVLILDCCNSGAFPQGTKAEVGGVMGLTQAFQGYGRFVLTASDATQFAWEGNKVIGETDNSLFTHFLVKGLEGEADSDGDGKITVDELYDYAFEEVSKVTPKQTPTKSASRVEGDIVLRQITRLEDIKPISLPNELLEATEDLRTFVREGAVQELEKILKGKNLGLARSAREVLERMERGDDSRRVSQAATQALEPIRRAEAEQKAKEEAESLLIEQKAEQERIVKARIEEERLATEKAQAEQKAREEAERLVLLKAEAERKAKEEKERLLAAQKAEEERLAREKFAFKQKENEEAERLLKAQIEPDVAERKTAEKALAMKEKKVAKSPWVLIGLLGGTIFIIILCTFAATRILPSIFVLEPSPTSTQDVNLIYTAAAQTVDAIAIQISPTSKPLFTPTVFSLTQATNAPSATPALCDRLAFMGDISIPDNSSMSPGQSFIKTWRVKNNGSCSWGTGYKLVYAGFADNMSGQFQSLPVVVQSGQEAELSVQFKAPAKAGEYISAWEMQNPKGIPFPDIIYVKIVVQ